MRKVFISFRQAEPVDVHPSAVGVVGNGGKHADFGSYPFALPCGERLSGGFEFFAVKTVEERTDAAFPDFYPQIYVAFVVWVQSGGINPCRCDGLESDDFLWCALFGINACAPDEVKTVAVLFEPDEAVVPTHDDQSCHSSLAGMRSFAVAVNVSAGNF